MVLVYSNANKKQNEGSLLIFFKIYFHGFRTGKIVGRTISWKNTFYTNCGEKILTLLLDKSVKWRYELCNNFLEFGICVFWNDPLLSDGVDEFLLCWSDVFQERFLKSCDAWRVNLVQMTPNPSIDYSNLLSDFHGNYNREKPRKLAIKAQYINHRFHIGSAALCLIINSSYTWHDCTIDKQIHFWSIT